MPKRNLEDLVGRAVAGNGGGVAVAESGTSEVPEFVAGAGPRYLQLVRKDTRLREDQLAALTDLARRLSRRRPRGGERITENTLMRVAVDLLLSQAGKLEGGTEADLLRAVGGSAEVR